MSVPDEKTYLFQIRNTLYMLDLLENGHRDFVKKWCDDNIESKNAAYEVNLYNKLIERNLGKRSDKGLLETHYTGFYRPNYSCQIHQIPIILEEVIGRKTDGYFVEAGAFDGESYSNTSFLADLGWRGLYIEPVMEYYQICRHRHSVNPDVTVLNGALGKSLDLIEIQIALMSSSSNQFLIDELRELEYSKNWITEEKRKIFTYRLDFLLEKTNAPKEFDLLVLDVEGAEWDALQGIDLDVWKPKLIIIELLDFHQDFSKNQPLFEIAIECRAHLKQWYDELYLDEGNTIYVRR